MLDLGLCPRGDWPLTGRPALPRCRRINAAYPPGSAPDPDAGGAGADVPPRAYPPPERAPSAGAAAPAVVAAALKSVNCGSGIGSRLHTRRWRRGPRRAGFLVPPSLLGGQPGDDPGDADGGDAAVSGSTFSASAVKATTGDAAGDATGGDETTPSGCRRGKSLLKDGAWTCDDTVEAPSPSTVELWAPRRLSRPPAGFARPRRK